jgi:hypothetical protein
MLFAFKGNRKKVKGTRDKAMAKEIDDRRSNQPNNLS